MAKIGTVIGTAAGAGGSFGQLTPFATAPAPTPVVVEAAPIAPEPVLPFPTADDMVAVNQWLTDFTTQMEDIDFGISQQEVDTKYQKGANTRQATEDRSAADEAMAARGIFTSSLRDAAAMDIEATRALANTYLDNKLQEAVTAGTTRKGTLATAKGNFEAAMTAKYGENAAGINQKLNEGYATALANYTPPKATAPSSDAARAPTATKKTPAATPKANTAQLAFKTTQQVANKAASQATSAARSRVTPSTKSPRAPKPKRPKTPTARR